MNPLAVELNTALEGSVAGSLLSDLGRRLYFPKGIVAQSAEAKKHAKALNATIGIAYRSGTPLFLQSVRKMLPDLAPEEIFPYAPTQGVEALREAWKKEIVRKNPDIGDAQFSLPLVVPGLTAGLSLLADLFVGKGDTVLLPDMYWDNYPLILETRREASLATFPLYTKAGGFNTEGLSAGLAAAKGGKCVLLLNFPNNPTGYSPTTAEAAAIVAAIGAAAAAGTRILVICDDAYFGLFYEQGTCTQSLFARLCALHENVLAAKVDGSTKEDLTWGFRTGFVTLGAKGTSAAQYDALTRKLMGAVRSTVSNSSILAQSLILRAMQSPDREGEKAEAYRLLKARYVEVRRIVTEKKSSVLTPLPFNSGYFMSFRLSRGKAEDLRKALLQQEVGTIAVDERCLRVAYSSVDVDRLADLYDRIYAAAEKLQ